MPRFNLLKTITFCILLSFYISGRCAYAQQTLTPFRDRDTTVTLSDSLMTRRAFAKDSLLKPGRFVRQQGDSLAAADSIPVQDSLAVADSLVKNKGMLEYPVFSEAKDSTIEDFSGPHKMIYYYGGEIGRAHV